MKSVVVKNLVAFVDSYGFSDRAFEQSVKWSNGYYGKLKSDNVSFSIDKLVNVLEKYPDLNIHWLFTGRGKMLVGKHEVDPIITSESHTIYQQLSNLEPYIPPVLDANFKELKKAVSILIDENEAKGQQVERLLESQKAALKKMEELFSV